MKTTTFSFKYSCPFIDEIFFKLQVDVLCIIGIVSIVMCLPYSNCEKYTIQCFDSHVLCILGILSIVLCLPYSNYAKYNIQCFYSPHLSSALLHTAAAALCVKIFF